MGRYLNAIRYICNPKTKYKAHVTVRGPYSKLLDYSSLLEYNSVIARDNLVIGEISSFFSSNQNTVFLKCDSTNLYKIWFKKDYIDFNPHITIYDGKSRNFAEKLLSILNGHLMNFTCKIQELSELRSMQERQNEYIQYLESNISFIRNVLKIDLSSDLVVNIPEREKLDIIDSLISHLCMLKAKKKLRIVPAKEELSENIDLHILENLDERPLNQKNFDLQILRY